MLIDFSVKVILTSKIGTCKVVVIRIILESVPRTDEIIFDLKSELRKQRKRNQEKLRRYKCYCLTGNNNENLEDLINNNVCLTNQLLAYLSNFTV